ncbi:hypothetical protein [Nitrospira sp. KM1]|nr:hypothetical protein [Nitrospira sp. KM1]
MIVAGEEMAGKTLGRGMVRRAAARGRLNGRADGMGAMPKDDAS